MKKIILLAALMTAALTQNISAQNAAAKPAGFLAAYYQIKDALVAGNAELASQKAAEFKTSLAAAEAASVNEASKSALTKSAAEIAGSKNIQGQREAFATLSTAMLAVAKAGKISAEPVYLQYCPMKKSSWLSSEKAVKNPYYGKAMLTCGKVTETL